MLENLVAVITGGSGGIGRAIALGLARQKAIVCPVGRNPDALKRTVDELTLHSASVHALRADLTVDGDIREVAQSLRDRFGRVDILVHCAGVYMSSDVQDASLEDFDLLYRTNVRGPYYLTQLLLPMLKSCRGQIVFLNSSQGLTAGARVSQYAATQHAKKAIADSLRDESNQHGVRVLSVFPGRTATSMTQSLYAREQWLYDPALLLQPEDIAAVVVNALCLPRTAEVTNVIVRPMTKSY